MDEPPEKPQRKISPRQRKQRDNARQRKMCITYDKSSRKHAPRVKMAANRKVRRAGIGSDLLCDEEDAAAKLHAAVKTKRRHWGSYNAAENRAWRDAERAYLDETAGKRPGGRDARYFKILSERLQSDKE